MIYEFTISVVGEGNTEEEAWQDAKQSAEIKVSDDDYDDAQIDMSGEVDEQ